MFTFVLTTIQMLVLSTTVFLFQRHFAVFCLPQPQDEALKSVVNGILDVNMGLSEKPAVDIDLHNSIVSASCKLLVSVQKVLRISPMPGRRHYLFTLRDIVTCFQVNNHICMLNSFSLLV